MNTTEKNIEKELSKICGKCGIEKTLDNFFKSKNNKYGVDYFCKKCRKEKTDEFNELNENYESLYNLNNKDKLNIYYSERYYSNRETILSQRKEYSYLNRNKINSRVVERYNKDPLFRLSSNVRNIIRNSIKNGGFVKTSKTIEIIGCSFEEFKLYLESKFEDWMSWDNYGKYNGELNYGWDIDHIIPISSAKTESEILYLNYYKNLQPLCSYINRHVKRNKLDYGIKK